LLEFANFQPSVVYKAVVYLEVEDGWTFDGVVESDFAGSHSKATAIYYEGGNDRAVTLVFPRTLGEFAFAGVIGYDGNFTTTFPAYMPVHMTSKMVIRETTGSDSNKQTNQNPLDFEWSTSDNSVAIVDANGKVTAVGVGDKLGDVMVSANVPGTTTPLPYKVMDYSKVFTWAKGTGGQFLIGNIRESKVTSSAAGWGTYSNTNAAYDATATITAKRKADGATATRVVTTSTRSLGTLQDTATTNVSGLGYSPAAKGLKDRFASYFLIGNIEAGGITNAWFKNHFNIVTMQNGMKPDQTNGSGQNTSSINTTTGVVTINSSVGALTSGVTVINNGYKLHGHVLYWHEQNANWASDTNFTNVWTNAGKEGMKTAMRTYAAGYMGHSNYKGKVYSWDVLNEVFNDEGSWDTPANVKAAPWQSAVKQGTVSTSRWGSTGGTAPGFSGTLNNPWVRVMGPEDAIYYMFYYARMADPQALLSMNDFNSEFPNKGKWFYDAIKYVNDRYKQEIADGIVTLIARPATDLGGNPMVQDRLIDIIGWQEHHNLSHHIDDTRYPVYSPSVSWSTTAANSVLTQFDRYRPLGVKVAVTELDVVQMTSEQFNANNSSGLGGNQSQTNAYFNMLRQADYYYKLFKVYLLNHDILDRVTWWGSTGNWRSSGQPLPWNAATSSYLKPAFYGILRALEEYEEAGSPLAGTPAGRAFYDPFPAGGPGGTVPNYESW